MLFSLFKRTLALTLTAALAFALAFSAYADEPPKLERLRVSNSNIVMTVGQTKNLFVRFTPVTAAQPVTWSSDNTSVVTVDATGAVTAVGKGEAYITAEAGGLSNSCRVTVRKVGQDVPARELVLSLSTMSVRVDQQRTLWASVLPSDSTDTDIYWSSSDNNVAGVDGEGTVTGVAPGTAVITAITGGGVSATCTVKVPDSVLKGVTSDVEVSEEPGGGELLSSAAVRTAVREAAGSAAKGSTVTVSFTNKTSLSPTVLKAAAYATTQSGRDVLLRFVTTDSKNKTQGTLAFDPLLAKQHEISIKPGVYLSSARAGKTAARFKKAFSNELYAVELAQEGAYGLPVQVTAALGLSGVKPADLTLYSYNYAANKYSRISPENLRVDSNGTLRFTAERGGIILVSKGALKK